MILAAYNVNDSHTAFCYMILVYSNSLIALVHFMASLSVEQRIFVCCRYFKHESAGRVRREFREQFPGARVPSRYGIKKIVNKFKTVGSVLNQKRIKQPTVLTDEKIQDICKILERDPRKSLRKLAQQSDVSYSSARRAAKKLKLKPHDTYSNDVSTNTSNKHASQTKKAKRSNQSKIEEMLEPEIKCNIEERSLEFDESWKISRVEYSSASHMASKVKSEPLSDDEERNSNGDVATAPAADPNQTSFPRIFVKEELQSTESEMEIPVTEELNVIRVKGELIEDKVVETMVAADSC